MTFAYSNLSSSRVWFFEIEHMFSCITKMKTTKSTWAHPKGLLIFCFRKLSLRGNNFGGNTCVSHSGSLAPESIESKDASFIELVGSEEVEWNDNHTRQGAVQLFGNYYLVGYWLEVRVDLIVWACHLPGATFFFCVQVQTCNVGA